MGLLPHVVQSLHFVGGYGTGGEDHRVSRGSRNIPTANLMLGSQSLRIGGVKPNYTIHAFLSGIVLFGGIIDSEYKQVWFSFAQGILY